MPTLTFEATHRLPAHGDIASATPAASALAQAIASDAILRCNTQADLPDPRYWTAYDYYMIEREARAMRTARINALIGKIGRALSRRLFG